MQIKFKKGFTLIELMVVIAIIGLLASVIIVSLTASQDKARAVKARAELIQIIRAADLARILTQTNLIGVTGSGCSVCSGEGTMVTSLQNISSKSGVPNLANLRADPWGGRYWMDENEAEFNSTDCRRDIIYAGSAPSGYASATSWHMDYQTAYCKANPASGSAGWQASI